MGIVFSPDGARFYASGGENGNIWVGDVATGHDHRLGQPQRHRPPAALARRWPNRSPTPPATSSAASAAASPAPWPSPATGKYLYVVDQGNFSVHVIDTAKIARASTPTERIIEMNNFPAVVGNVRVGRYPFGITLAPDDSKLYVANVGVFQYSHLIPRGPDAAGRHEPPNPTGDNNAGLPALFPRARLPGRGRGRQAPSRSRRSRPHHQHACRWLCGIRTGIRCGYVPADRALHGPGPGQTRTSTNPRRSTCWTSPAPPRPTRDQEGEDRPAGRRGGGRHRHHGRQPPQRGGHRQQGGLRLQRQQRQHLHPRSPGLMAVVRTTSAWRRSTGWTRGSRASSRCRWRFSPDEQAAVRGRGLASTPSAVLRVDGIDRHGAGPHPHRLVARAASSCRPTAAACSSPAPRAGARRPTWSARAPTRTATPSTACSGTHAGHRRPAG